MSEKITIKNFGGLDEVVIPLNSINIFIGKQASGKSVSAKLIFYFKSFFNDALFGLMHEKNVFEIRQEFLTKFRSYFPQEVWEDDEFEIVYEFEKHKIKIEKKLNSKLKLSFDKGFSTFFDFNTFSLENSNSLNQTEALIAFRNMYSKNLKKNFGELSSNSQVFIPAGRSFFATLQNSIFSLLSENEPIDPFLIEFGRFYNQTKIRRTLDERKRETDKTVENLITKILVGKYKREKNKDYIIHHDKRKIEVSYASSGQQEVLPLSIVLSRFIKTKHVSGGTTVFIEEPEAHLFPSAQKNIVELIATVYNNSIGNLQFVITTHSPYILSAFNNLLQAGLLKEQGKDEAEIEKVVSKFSIIKPNELNAFEMRDGKLIDLIDKEYGLITAATLDKASEDIAKEFDALLELE
jgi:predicted ATP-dependent endonuclease of OLD family